MVQDPGNVSPGEFSHVRRYRIGNRNRNDFGFPDQKIQHQNHLWRKDRISSKEIE